MIRLTGPLICATSAGAATVTRYLAVHCSPTRAEAPDAIAKPPRPGDVKVVVDPNLQGFAVAVSDRYR